MNPIESALEHIQKELMMSQIRCSLEADFEQARKAHDSIHQFMLLAAKLVPADIPGYSFHRNSAYLVYHWEIFDLTHRSSLEALSTFYNASFVLLRTTIELMIKGAFFDCLAHKKFRDNSSVLDNLDEKQKGHDLKPFIEAVITQAPEVADDLENSSVSIYDKIESVALDPNFMPSTSKMLEQLVEWGIFEGIQDAYDLVYRVYGELSPNVHVLPDYTDIGRVLLSEEKPFQERKVMQKYLLEYLGMLHRFMDIGMVVIVNILQDNIRNSKEVRDNFTNMLNDQQFRSLGLQYTPSRIMALLKY